MNPCPVALAAVIGLAASPAAAVETQVDLDIGHRTDSLRWNIATDSSGTATPNILSELTWEDLRIVQAALGWRMTTAGGLHLRTTAAYGTIYDGRNQDSDYAGNNRTLEFSRSNNDTDDDDVLDLTAAIGYRFTYLDQGVNHVTPLLGYSYHEQNLRITNGNQTIPSTGPFSGLNSTYQTAWNGPWAGIEFDSAMDDTTRSFLRVQYHASNYRAEADWNLRTDFAHPKSFEHRADGAGVTVALGFYRISVPGRWSGRLGLDYQRWETDPGVDQVFFANGTTSTTRLNEVVWKSWAISLGLQRRF